MDVRRDLDAVLDEFHAAAASADEERYFATLAADVVYLGTAPGERWQGNAWREFVHSYFSRGRGWRYIPSARSIALAESEQTAWFDETVENEHYGSCRGSGVLQRTSDGWKVQQYNLTLPIPDEIAPDVVTRVRSMRPA